MAQPAGYLAAFSDGPSPFKPLLFIGLALTGLALPWYFTYEPLQQQFNFMILILPLLLVLAVVYLTSSPDSVLQNVLPASDPSSIHRVGGSPVGLGVLLFLVLVMLWYHTDILDTWNPLVRL